jgi:hypothetical protein
MQVDLRTQPRAQRGGQFGAHHRRRREGEARQRGCSITR